MAQLEGCDDAVPSKRLGSKVVGTACVAICNPSELCPLAPCNSENKALRQHAVIDDAMLQLLFAWPLFSTAISKYLGSARKAERTEQSTERVRIVRGARAALGALAGRARSGRPHGEALDRF